MVEVEQERWEEDETASTPIPPVSDLSRGGGEVAIPGVTGEARSEMVQGLEGLEVVGGKLMDAMVPAMGLPRGSGRRCWDGGWCSQN